MLSSLLSLHDTIQTTVPLFHSNNMARVQHGTFYDVLGISQNADHAAIKTAYKKMSRQCHPDKNLGNGHAVARQQAVCNQSLSTVD